MDEVVQEHVGVISNPSHIDVKLLNCWSFDDLTDVSLSAYIGVAATKIPRTVGRYFVKRFRKFQCPIVVRLTNSLMMYGRNNGKNTKVVSVTKHAMQIIHFLTDQNLIQAIVDVVVNRYASVDPKQIFVLWLCVLMSGKS
ncbi:unnamed protein product [Lathyrus sativus]|nr:unnamed protein product [Lathyrus sativus]